MGTRVGNSRSSKPVEYEQTLHSKHISTHTKQTHMKIEHCRDYRPCKQHEDLIFDEMNSSRTFLKSFDYSKYKIILRHNSKIPKPEIFLLKKKSSPKSLPTKPAPKVEYFDDDDAPSNFFGYLLLVIPISTFCLGTWQIQRRKWKLNLMEEINSRFYLEPRDLLANLKELENMEYTPVKLRGKYLHEKEFTIGPRGLISDNMELNEQNKSLIATSAGTGYHVICPFKLEDKDLTILVNRGWVPEEYRVPSSRPLGQVEGVQEITGIVRLSEKRATFVPKNQPQENRWFYRDVEEMANLKGTDPIFIDLSDNTRKPGTPIGSQTRISFRNEHLSYIVTWYGLSIATAYMWYKQHLPKTSLP